MEDPRENGDLNDDELLTGIDDFHGGVIVDLKEPMDPEIFLLLLRASISQWRNQRKKGVWIKLPIALVNLVETAVKEGFRYHHAEPNYLMLVYWIPETASTLPANASHRVSVGGIVLNDKREAGGYPTLLYHNTTEYMSVQPPHHKEVLVVQEKSGKLRGTGVWKIPTGIVDEGEDIFMAAMREVKEETGIDTEFLEIVAFRQAHKSFFEKSDLFFLCMLRPLSFDIQKQELEIEAAQWMPLEDFVAQPFAQKHDILKHIANLCLAKVDRDYTGFSPITCRSFFTDQPDYLYANILDLKR